MNLCCRKILTTLILLTPSLSLGKNSTVCLVERITKSLPTYGTSFENGVKLAMSELGPNLVLESRSFFYDPDPMAPMKIYPQLKDANCDAIIGFSYLADLLIFIEALKRDRNHPFAKVPIFTPFATIEAANKPDLRNVFFFNLTPSHLAHSMFDYLNINKKIRAPIIITEINRIEMIHYRDAYDQIFRKNNWQTTHISIHENMSLPLEKISAVLTPDRTVILLGGVVSSAKIINLTANKNPIYVGTENFGSSTAMSLFNSLSSKNHTVYFVRQLDMLQKKSALTDFMQKYRHKFDNHDPSILALYGYEATKIIGLTVQKFHKSTPETIRKINYTGASGFSCNNGICETSGEPAILRLTKIGYELVDSQR